MFLGLHVNDWITIIGVLVLIEGAIGHGTVSLTNAVPERLVPTVQAWCNILAFVGGAIMTALSRVAAVLAVGVLLLALAPDGAHAQDKRKIGGPVGEVLDRAGVKPLPGPGQGGDDARGGTQGAGFTSPLDKPFQDLANFIGDDIDAAIELSTSIPSLQDGTGQKCLMALKTFGDVIKKHPAPLTFKIASDLEAFRLKQAAINNLCQSTDCTQVFSDFTQVVTALTPIPLPVPNVHDLCAKVPRVTLGTPVAVPPAPGPGVPPANP